MAEQQQMMVLQSKLQQAEASLALQHINVRKPLCEQQLPQNPPAEIPLSQNASVAEAVADALDRPPWQNPMALHLSEAEKAELKITAEAGRADENGPPQSLLAGHPGMQQWEEKKKMQKRVDMLRAKLKV